MEENNELKDELKFEDKTAIYINFKSYLSMTVLSRAPLNVIFEV